MRPRAPRILHRTRWWWALILVLGVWPRAARAGGEGLAWQLLSEATPRRICQELDTEVELRIRNDGDETWSDAAGDRLAYHWLARDRTMVELDGVRTRLPHEVAPGEELTVRARVEPPAEPGRYRLQWAMVREDVRWYPRPAGEVNAELDVEVGGPAFRWSLDEMRPVSRMVAGERVAVDLAIRNTGCETWEEGKGDGMSYAWSDAEGRVVSSPAVRTSWPAPVAPGRTVLLRATVQAPASPGSYHLRWEPLREHVSWYGRPDAGDPWMGPVQVSEGVLAWSAVGDDVPTSMRAMDELVATVRIRNDGTEAWDPAAGDAVGYHWRDAGGEVVEYEGPRTPVPRQVAPGDEVEVSLRIVAPRNQGQYWLEMEPVRDGVRWLGKPQEGAAEVAVSVLAPGLAWSASPVAAPTTMWAGRQARAHVRVKNEGAEVWSPQRADHVSYRWVDTRTGEVEPHEGLRSQLPGPVAPGEEVDVILTVRAPAEPGPHELRVEMVREHVRWYGPPVSGQPVVRVKVRPGSVLGAVGLVLGVALGLRLAWRRPAWSPAVAAGFMFGLVLVLQVTFSERGAFEPWAGAGWVVLCVAAGAAALAWVTPGRVRAPVVVALAVALTVVVLADLAYLHFFGTIVPVAALAAAHQILDVSASAGSLLGDDRATIALLALATVGATALPRVSAVGRTRWIVVGGLVALCVPGALRLREAASGTLATRVFSESDNVKRFGVHGAHLFALLRQAAAGDRPALGDEERGELIRLYRQRARDRTESAVWRGAARGANVVVIQAEALQHWVVDAEVGGEPVMPFVREWTAEGLRFDQVFDQTEQGNTSDAEYLVLASQHPLTEGALAFLREDVSFHTWIHELARRGYATVSAHPYERGFWNRAVLHPKYGFETSLFRRELGEGPRVGWGLADGVFLERMVDRLEELPRPHAAFLVTLGLHHPYDSFPERYAELELGDLTGTRLGNYLQAMRYLDRSLAAFVAALRERGMLERTLLVIYGDHDARLERTPELAALVGLPGWDPSAGARIDRVPLLVRVPDGRLRGAVQTIGGQVDIGPTILHLLGVEVPRGFTGRPLAPGAADFAAHRAGGAVTTDRIFVGEGEDIPREGGCFHYPSGRSRGLEDCTEIRDRAAREQGASRQILDHDLFGEL